MTDLEVLIKKKTDLERRKERLIGKLESARSNLSELDRRLLERGIQPDELGDEIIKLKREKEEIMQQLNKSISEAEIILNRIESRVDSL